MFHSGLGTIRRLVVVGSGRDWLFRSRELGHSDVLGSSGTLVLYFDDFCSWWCVSLDNIDDINLIEILGFLVLI